MHDVKVKPMADGKASGISVKWDDSQFCLIVTDRGFLGCGIFSPEVIDEFSMTAALAKGTIEKPLIEPEDLLGAKVSTVSEAAKKIGIENGMNGQEVLQKLLTK